MHKHLLRSAIHKLKSKGAEYADIRWVRRQHENLSVLNQNVENISSRIDEGYGIRTLYNGAWGFTCGSIFKEEEIEKNIRLAINIARASSAINKDKVIYPAYPAAHASYSSGYQINPFEVSQDAKLHYLFYTNEILLQHPKIKFAQSTFDFYHTKKFFINTEDSEIEQSFIESGGFFEVVACEGTKAQKRSYPISHHSQIRQSGYEYIKELNFPENAPRIRDEAVMLLGAADTPIGETTIILDGYQTALQVHESCGHPVELDRVLGSELSYAGGSFLSLEKYGDFRYGSKLVNISADATLPGGVGSFAYDDEGVKGQRVELVKNGIFCGYLSSRESADVIKKDSNGTMRAESWNHIPLVRMTNINLEPQTPSFEELIADTKEGLYLCTNKSWSIDELRLNFQFGCEIAWQIKNGKLKQPYKNPIYYSNTPYFWNNCTGVANKDSWYIWGIPTCGKGEPAQSIHVGHAVSPARFEKIMVGIRK
jgi:TldD protein